MNISKKQIRYTMIALLVLLIIIQFFQIDKTNPEVTATKDFLRIEGADEELTDLIKSACYDCHSHEVIYPWYTRIQPIGWWVKGHVKGGVKHLNFSAWGDYEPKRRNHKLEECVDMMKNEDMPLKSYTWIHEKSRLSEVERSALIDWFASL